MSGRATSVVTSVLLTAWSAGAALGSVPMGSPLALLEEGRWAVGLEYGYAETHLQAYGLSTTTLTGESPTAAFEVLEIEELRSHMVWESLAYGVCDNWDLFLRVGTADGRDDVIAHTGRFAYDGGSDFGWGLGTRATFCQWGPWTFGGSAQVTWLNPDSASFSATDPQTAGRVSVGTADLDLWQTQVSLAAGYQIDTLTLWAGPFLEFTEGDLDRSGRILIDGADSGTFHATDRIDERSQFGVHFGVLWEKSDALSLWTGGQITGNSWSVGVGGILQPQRLFDRR